MFGFDLFTVIVFTIVGLLLGWFVVPAPQFVLNLRTGFINLVKKLFGGKAAQKVSDATSGTNNTTSN